MKYCIECGTELILKACFNCGISEGLVQYCPKCGEFRFQNFNVAVSTVIYNKDFSKILLIQQYGRNLNILVAGYVNKGEALEEALKREIAEEVGLNVLSFRYNESQYFEKSNSLICNFITQVNNENFTLTNEVDSAKWFDVSSVQEEIAQNSLAEYFLKKSLDKVKILTKPCL